MAVQLCEDPEHHQIIHFRWVNLMVSESYLKNLF